MIIIVRSFMLCNFGISTEASACTRDAFIIYLQHFSFTAPCLPLAPIPNGNITYGPDMMANFEVDTVATHSCNDDFFLSGPETRVCLPSGIWSNRIPVCLRT